jgi:hypothetical protein
MKLTFKNIILVLFLIQLIGFENISFAQTTETFNTPGAQTWTCPIGVTSVTVTAWGGGGGGGGGYSGANDRSGGGGGGGCQTIQIITVTEGDVLDIYVGQRGLGGTAADPTGNTGVNGETSSIVSVGNYTVTAGGGMGGNGGTALSGGAGGAGCYVGGNGNNGGIWGGKGGDGQGVGGGSGGAGVNNNQNNGSAPGGGGSGGGDRKNGGNGGNGLVVFVYNEPGCGSGGGEDATITANSYNSICPGVRETISFVIIENDKATIPQNASGDLIFSFVMKSNYIFTGNDLTITIVSAPSADLNSGYPAPVVSLIDPYTISITGLETGSGGGYTNSIDQVTITAEVEGVGLGNDAIERCGGSFTTNFIDDGTDVAFFYANTMSYVTTTVAQASTDDVPPNSINNEILVFNVSTTNGACNPIDVTEIVWTTTGTTDLNDVSEATIFYTGNSNLFVGINPFDNRSFSFRNHYHERDTIFGIRQ